MTPPKDVQLLKYVKKDMVDNFLKKHETVSENRFKTTWSCLNNIDNLLGLLFM